jgi:aspartate 1-decarboxylase
VQNNLLSLKFYSKIKEFKGGKEMNKKIVLPFILIGILMLTVFGVIKLTQHSGNGNAGSSKEVIDSADIGSKAKVSINGRQIMVEGKPFYIKGVCWNPVAKGKRHPEDIDYSGFVDVDAKLMKAAGINTVRTYEPITDKAVLDKLYSNGIYVINSVYSWGGSDPRSAADAVNKVKDHPAILMWSIGNEWNYNGIYYNLSTADSIKKLNEAAEAIKAADSDHLITTIYGNMPTKAVMESMPNVDVWGINMYRGLNFGNAFDEWKYLSNKPMYMAEYGADAWNATKGSEDVDAQGKAARELTQLLMNNSVIINSDNVCSGGLIFEWADEWWKDSEGALDKQDVGGIAPGGGPYPDSTFNEEYWGLVDIDRNPRPAYYELQKIFTEYR